ncbi:MULTISPECIES: SDR family NAD(P)-dependent oxidoreductase [unclassified Mesorhizobium]|uniref:SDR family NAD(P)-dependent oxidoreductase n=1 Tax=unclassified Mesorhizobium TaxID=325217 RepID=UPI000FCB07AC|nr:MULTISPECIES: glucose 1-dehydrogenase [unclassified Mesorhizobium]RUW36803.1 glucose 1-dehydrogenase [Mesorhizobium sp. M1E.F.Ca.ET.041.01.1.1]RWD84903.1 MAG: glucose 1-dehydrogenase [Mesorhizobium sp.]RWD90028.1 MAG: glucose 1-dehydrogenase [Mesorhizobium sp.]TIV54177.1 MAG: glucose 1-dehydrogenase [Mesorhizobium sp.]
MVDAAPASLPETPSFRLDGRRALVTGAGRGIGAAMAAALAEAGAEVVLAARTATEVESVAADIAKLGGTAAALTMDVTDVAMVREILATQPAFHILVNNAGTNRPKPLTEVTEDDYRAVVDLNLKASFFVSQTVANRMASESIRGSIIFMSSQMGHVGAPQRTLYCASKHAVEGLTKAMAIELGPQGIRVNTIAPTFIETPMTRPFLLDPAFKQSVLANIRLGRLGRVEDLMGAVVYLASDASALVTGTSLLVDGGWTAG